MVLLQLRMKSINRIRRGFVLVFLFFSCQAASALDYEKDIMPVFEKKCFDCHSEKADKVKGGLKLDDPEHFHGRFPKDQLVTPGDPKLSGLYYSLTRPRYDKGAMPPEKKGKQLTEDEIKLVRDWILEGAPINGTRGKRGKPVEEEKSPAMKRDKPKEMKWTNREGNTIVATVVRIESDIVILRLGNGQVYRYPIANLSDESQAKLKELPSAK